MNKQHLVIQSLHITSIITVNSNRPFAASHSRGTNLLCWRAKVALGQDKQRKYHFKLCISFVCLVHFATFVLRLGGFVSGEWLAAKGLFTNHTAAQCCRQ